MRSRPLARLLAALSVLASCGGGAVHRFPLREPMLRDDDARPFHDPPKSYWSPKVWDAADNTLFLPLTRFFAVDPGGEAVNVNALDEVPDSSWFQNRMGARPMSVEGYPNPAFGRMTERDAAWMARIIAGFSDEHIAALVELGALVDPVAKGELVRILRERRDTILVRYLGRLSALTRPRLHRGELCLDDVAVTARVARREQRRYAARAWVEGAAVALPAVRLDGEAAVCVAMPPPVGPRRYVVVDVLSDAPHARRRVPARVHLYDLGADGMRVVGLERPAGDRPPGS